MYHWECIQAKGSVNENVLSGKTKARNSADFRLGKNWIHNLAQSLTEVKFTALNIDVSYVNSR